MVPRGPSNTLMIQKHKEREENKKTMEAKFTFFTENCQSEFQSGALM